MDPPCPLARGPSPCQGDTPFAGFLPSAAVLRLRPVRACPSLQGKGDRPSGRWMGSLRPVTSDRLLFNQQPSYFIRYISTPSRENRQLARKNRFTTVTSFQPPSSKWWCKGAIRKIRFPWVSLKYPTWSMTDRASST